MDDNIKKDLTCTRCGDTKETYAEIVYSQGDRVCTNCKKELLPGDKLAFDGYMKSKEIPRMR